MKCDDNSYDNPWYNTSFEFISTSLKGIINYYDCKEGYYLYKQ